MQPVCPTCGKNGEQLSAHGAQRQMQCPDGHQWWMLPQVSVRLNVQLDPRRVRPVGPFIAKRR